MGPRAVGAATLIVLTAIGTAGCSSGAHTVAGGSRTSTPTVGSSASSAAPRPAAGDDCVTYRPGGHPVYFGPASGLAGYLYGTGNVGVVFAHQSDGDACDWMPEAARLAKLGYRALAVDLDGYGASKTLNRPYSDDVADAIDFLTGQGATSVVLIGASMGGTAVLTAAATTKARLAAVIALSSPADYAGMDALDAAPHINAPLLMMCGIEDTGFVGAVQDIYGAATATKHKRLVLVDTDVHGKLLVEQGPDVQPKSYAAYTAFLATYAPPTAVH
ncbi:MAG TPA: alpha/beta hydrolase [Micromonosporaceae bacterium]|nr:alpha/beta hydrolase [Micromonosporaceae bacterium]